jgi:hypothetical protein
MQKQGHPVSRAFLMGLIFVLVVVSVGCSFTVGFNIKNLSGKTITVNYSVNNSYYGFSPLLVRENVDENSEKYVPIPEDRIHVDIDNGTVEFSLLPDEEVQLYWVSDRLDRDYEEVFKIDSLRITDEYGSITFEGRRVFNSFRPVENSRFAFGPKIVGFVFEYR